jgi:hypothetical protein
MLGRSITLNFIATARTGHVKNPAKTKEAAPRVTNCMEVILMGFSIDNWLENGSQTLAII